MSSQSQIYSGLVDDENPQLFDIRAMPPQPKDVKPGQLPIETIKQFFEDVSTVLHVLKFTSGFNVKTATYFLCTL
jgi:hypothetical protein